MKKKIFISAPGLVCCAGQNRDELYESCIKGYQGGITSYKGSLVGQIPDGNLPEPAGKTKKNRIFKIIDVALEQIRPEIEKAIAAYGPEKIGVCLGSCDNGSELSIAAHKEFFEKGAFPKDYNLRFQSASSPAEYISDKFGLKGPVYTIATACASGASAIVKGTELMRAGIYSAVIAGGADIVSDTVLTGFNALGAVSDSLSNPCSKNRKGINLGEGAAFFLLDFAETVDGIELLGAGESADAYHMTAPGEDGAGPAKAMKAAILDAGIKPEEIGYVNMHGTGTPHNDKAEALALTTVFSQCPPTSSTKPITGHTLGAASAIEAAICWMIISGKKGLPVHCWDGVRDEAFPALPLDIRDVRPSICMSNSFAFGGCNVILIIGRTLNESRTI
ncbi:MAG: 3-oxoacyl-ACP synthase [Treponema sp.]|nr:3-oxoacyl-ACP synthase [Treponema sp.]